MFTYLDSRGSVVTTELCYHVIQNIVDVPIKFSGKREDLFTSESRWVWDWSEKTISSIAPTVSHFSPGSFGFLVRAYVMGKLKKTSVRISFGTAMLSLKQKHSDEVVEEKARICSRIFFGRVAVA